MTRQKLYEWAFYEINLSIPEVSLPKRTRPHLRINNNDVRAIPLEKIPHTKATPEDPRIFYDESLPPSPTSSEIDELDQLLQKELFNYGFFMQDSTYPTMQYSGRSSNRSRLNQSSY